MKALYQEWKPRTPGIEWQKSISKDMEQYKETLARQELEGDDGIDPLDGDPIPVEVDDRSAFPEMLERDTVFLHDDEMIFLTFP